jgi:3-phenylpropionate/cinnamic acid dioxygenase small subunit
MCEEILGEVEQFLYREARLLDERRFHEWLELLSEDIRSWMPVRSNRDPKASKAISILDPDRYMEEDLAKDDELAILDETKETLARRIARLDTGMAWAEDPRRAPATSSPISRSSLGKPSQSCRSTPTSWCTEAAQRPSRTSTWARGRTSSGTSMVRGRSPAAKSSSTRTCSWRRTSASFFRRGASVGGNTVHRGGTHGGIRKGCQC